MATRIKTLRKAASRGKKITVRGKKGRGAGTDGFISPGAARTKYSRWKKAGKDANGNPVPALTSTEDKVKYITKVENAKKKRIEAKKKLKRQDKRSVKKADQFKKDYIKSQDESIATYEKALNKGNLSERGRKVINKKLGDAKLRKASAQKGGFGYDLTDRQITVMRKAGFNKSPQQLRTHANEAIKAKATKAVTGDAKSRLKAAKFTPKELTQYDNARRTLRAEKGLKGKPSYDRAKKIARLEDKVTQFEAKHGLKPGDVPSNIYGKGGVLKYKAPGRDSFVNTSGAEAARGNFNRPAQTGTTTKGRPIDRARTADAYEAIVGTGRGEIITTGAKSVASMRGGFDHNSYNVRGKNVPARSVKSSEFRKLSNKVLSKRRNEPAGTIKNPDASPSQWELSAIGKKYYAREITQSKLLMKRLKQKKG